MVLAEDIVDEETIRNDPNRTVIPAHAIEAVVHCPRGRASLVRAGVLRPGRRVLPRVNGDQQGPARLAGWLEEWVYALPDREAYVAKLGEQRWGTLAVAPRLSGQVDYGRRRP